ncbi:hypothetical protein AALP_AA6G320600 [Arabis alpina]|uniref:AT-hook motif nuclear-localized protein n=1 Tax=Arabis alpina TaxID=50452 RepID=A0A087GT23_ARAAL|nr:hypothetical protein AALP_AA6G320600 [Arabis alpina]
MEGQEAMAFTGAHHHHQPPQFYFPGGRAFTSISPSQSASALHAPPSLSNPNMQHPFPFSHHQEFVMQSPSMIPQPSPSVVEVSVTEEEVVKKKRGRPRKYVPETDSQVALGLSPMDSSSDRVKKSCSSLMSDPNEPKRARGRPPGTGRKQRLANVGPWMNETAGHAFAPHVISVEPGEDIVSKVLAFSQQRPRALSIMSGTGTVSSVTLRQPGTSVPSLSFQGPFEILGLVGSYLVNEEGGPKTRTGGIGVSLSRPDGHLLGGGVGTLIAASLVQVVACSFVYGSAKANKAIKQENRSNEHESNDLEATPASEEASPLPATEEEADQSPQDYSSPGWAGPGGRNISTDSGNHNHITDIDLTCG